METACLSLQCQCLLQNSQATLETIPHPDEQTALLETSELSYILCALFTTAFPHAGCRAAKYCHMALTRWPKAAFSVCCHACKRQDLDQRPTENVMRLGRDLYRMCFCVTS